MGFGPTPPNPATGKRHPSGTGITKEGKACRSCCGTGCPCDTPEVLAVTFLDMEACADPKLFNPTGIQGAIWQLHGPAISGTFELPLESSGGNSCVYRAFFPSSAWLHTLLSDELWMLSPCDRQYNDLPMQSTHLEIELVVANSAGGGMTARLRAWTWHPDGFGVGGRMAELFDGGGPAPGGTPVHQCGDLPEGITVPNIYAGLCCADPPPFPAEIRHLWKPGGYAIIAPAE